MKRALASSSSSRSFSLRRHAISASRVSGCLRPRGRASAASARRRGPAATPRFGWIQALPAQDRALLTRLRSLVGGLDLQLVLRGDVRRCARSGTHGPARQACHPSPVQHPPNQHAVEARSHVLIFSVPALGVATNSKRAGASRQLGREGRSPRPSGLARYSSALCLFVIADERVGASAPPCVSNMTAGVSASG